jgi:NhaP-type Na+/H+ and K+/H+ antiporter
MLGHRGALMMYVSNILSMRDGCEAFNQVQMFFVLRALLSEPVVMVLLPVQLVLLLNPVDVVLLQFRIFVYVVSSQVSAPTPHYHFRGAVSSGRQLRRGFWC